MHWSIDQERKRQLSHAFARSQAAELIEYLGAVSQVTEAVDAVFGKPQNRQ
ncbi:hypothetical protein G7007_12300 [Pseudomonas entomophila]|jgi:hypothetical protein|uniref:hypothetical protein n=1 Tax=Pseudomonas entomophila TaxID=312306 RepID=UPI0015E31EB7|nr:hypothetical protein [Pseudomonas entomophila]MBA1193634.1 hypothetical protein [Pseudomonas entomophila]